MDKDLQNKALLVIGKVTKTMANDINFNTLSVAECDLIIEIVKDLNNLYNDLNDESQS